MIKNFLCFLQTLALVDRFLIESTIKAFITVVLEDGEIQTRLDTCLLRDLHELFIVFSQLIT